MSIFDATANALCSEVHEQQIRKSINDLCRILRYDIVLQPSALVFTKVLSLLTSSHQSNVDVTGDQRPSCSGGYGIEGSREKKGAAISPLKKKHATMIAYGVEESEVESF